MWTPIKRSLWLAEHSILLLVCSWLWLQIQVLEETTPLPQHTINHVSYSFPGKVPSYRSFTASCNTEGKIPKAYGFFNWPNNVVSKSIFGLVTVNKYHVVADYHVGSHTHTFCSLVFQDPVKFHHYWGPTALNSWSAILIMFSVVNITKWTCHWLHSSLNFLLHWVFPDPLRVVGSGAARLLTVIFPKIYDSNAEPPCTLPNVVHEIESPWNWSLACIQIT